MLKFSRRKQIRHVGVLQKNSSHALTKPSALNKICQQRRPIVYRERRNSEKQDLRLKFENTKRKSVTREIGLGKQSASSAKTKVQNLGAKSGIPNLGDKKSKLALFGRLLRTPVGTETTNRYLMIIPTIAVHLSIGSIYCWSMYNAALATSLGVVAPSAADWTFSSVVPIFSAITFFHGLSAWLLSKWQVKVGPRKSLCLGALSFGGGMIMASLGSHLHLLPLLYIGYGLFGGIGIGLCYVPPMANLIRWFPDKVGFATGITSCGFGGAALIGAPLVQYFLSRNYSKPNFIGSNEDTITQISEDGRLFTQVGGQLREVVEYSKAAGTVFDLSLSEGFYEVATGSSGAPSTLLTMGSLYLVAIMAAAFTIRKPPSLRNKVFPEAPKTASGKTFAAESFAFSRRLLGKMARTVESILPQKRNLGERDGNVPIESVMATPQFYRLWILFAALATVGMSIAGTAKDMFLEVFSGALPSVVTPGFAVLYVSAFSLFNLGGRIFWASFSDRFGRKNTFRVFTAAGLPLALLLPLSISAILFFRQDSFAERFGGAASDFLALVALGCFLGSSLLVASIFGGTYATVPAFATEMFGRGSIDKVHGRLLTASSLAGICGPLLATFLRGRSEKAAIEDLLEKVDEKRFVETFGVGPNEAGTLIEAKTLTIAKLMEMVPEGTPDPTPKLYNFTLLCLSGFFVVGALANRGITKIPKKLYKFASKYFFRGRN